MNINPWLYLIENKLLSGKGLQLWHRLTDQ